MRALIIGNGEINDTYIIKKNIQKDDIIICCDGGVRYAFEEGISPNYIIGDLDSAPNHIISFFENKNICFKKFPTKKDNTDMELCLQFAISLGVSEIIIFGAIGTRFDHSLANVNILKICVDANVFAKIINENNEIMLINNSIKIYGQKGDLVSLIPLSTTVFGVTTKNLLYPLNNYNMEIGKALGVSNEMLENYAEINIENGYLLVIKSKD